MRLEITLQDSRTTSCQSERTHDKFNSVSAVTATMGRCKRQRVKEKNNNNKNKTAAGPRASICCWRAPKPARNHRRLTLSEQLLSAKPNGTVWEAEIGLRIARLPIARIRPDRRKMSKLEARNGRAAHRSARAQMANFFHESEARVVRSSAS